MKSSGSREFSKLAHSAGPKNSWPSGIFAMPSQYKRQNGDKEMHIVLLALDDRFNKNGSIFQVQSILLKTVLVKIGMMYYWLMFVVCVNLLWISKSEVDNVEFYERLPS